MIVRINEVLSFNPDQVCIYLFGRRRCHPLLSLHGKRR